jgi:flagellar assembly protein FliH
MSSFEPLFGAALHERRTPLVSSIIARSDVWLPARVDIRGDSAGSSLDYALDDKRAREAESARAAAEAGARARQAELDLQYAQGLTDGRAAGEQAEALRLRGALMATEAALDELQAGEARWLAHIEENIAAIAVGVAQQIIAREVTTSPDVVTALVSRAVEEFGLDQALSIRVNPGDLEALHGVSRDASAGMQESTAGRDVRWLSDSRIEPGGCVVEGRERIVDGRVDTALERLYRRLTHTTA